MIGARGGQWYPSPSNVQITIGPPLFMEQDGFDSAIALRDATRAAILAGCGEPDLAGEENLLTDPRTTPRTIPHLTERGVNGRAKDVPCGLGSRDVDLVGG